MSFGHQPPPPKTTGTGTIVGILALVFIGLPALLCLVGGIAFWGMAGFPGGKFGGKEAAWQKVVVEKQRLERELIAELKTIADANGNRIPVSEVSRISMRGLEIDGKINELANRTHREHGEPSQAVKDELKSTAELQRFVDTLKNNNSFSPPTFGSPPFSPSSPPGQSLSERVAQQRAETEQRLAAMRAEQAQRDAQRLAEAQARDQQLAAQRLAEQQAREQRMREFANNVPQPQPFNPPPMFNNPPPVNNPPAAPQQPAANDAPPGFPATDLAQLKLKDPVFVQVGGQWHPAFVQLKRGKLVQVRSTENGAVELVTIERIRLQNEPTAKADGNLPSALQVAKAPKTSAGNTPEEEDDALFIAKPPGQQPGQQAPPPAQTPAASTPSSPAEPVKPAAPVAEYRTWTNDTGEFKVEAELVNFEFDLVTLRRRDGKVLSLRIEKLSAADQAVIREKFK
jgi:flagellar biosynthesis GTPase FlhF